MTFLYYVDRPYTGFVASAADVRVVAKPCLTKDFANFFLAFLSTWF